MSPRWRPRATTMLVFASIALTASGLVCGAYSQQCPRTAAISTGLLGVACGAIVTLKDRASETTRQWWRQMWKSLRTRSPDLEEGIAAAVPHLALSFWRRFLPAHASQLETFVTGLETFLGDTDMGDTDMVREVKRNVRTALLIMRHRGIAKPVIIQDAALEELLTEILRTYRLARQERDVLATHNPFEGQVTLLVEISRVWVECASIVADEHAKRSRGSEAARNLMDSDDRIVRFKRELETLCEGWQYAQLKQLEASTLLNRLEFVHHAGFDGRNTCYPGTRTDILHTLTEWVDRPDATQVLFLIGAAGSGKSTIANTLAVRLRDRKRLGAFFAFDRRVSDRVPHRLLFTLAYQLALWNESYRDALVRQLKDHPALAGSSDIVELWDHLIVQPAAALASSEPVLLVVDALDECPGSLDGLLGLFTSQIAQLRTNFRVLITSRAEQKIIAATQPSQRFDIGGTQATEDIRLYVRTRLPRSEAGGLSDDECEELARTAGGLFQWAATACAFLERGLAGTTMQNKYLTHRGELLLGSSRGERGLPQLDHLYLAVLEAAVDQKDAHVMRIFRIAMSLLLCATKPLSLAAIQSLVEPSQVKDVASSLGALGVLLEGTSNPSMPLRPIHVSFRDFLLDETRSKGWCLFPEDLEAARRALSIGTSHEDVVVEGSPWSYFSHLSEDDLSETL